MINKTRKYLDFKLIGLLSLFYLIFVIIYASKNAYLIIYFKSKVDWGEFIFGNILDYFIIIIFTIFLAFTTKMMIQKKNKAGLHCLHSFILFFFYWCFYNRSVPNNKSDKI